MIRHNYNKGMSRSFHIKFWTFTREIEGPTKFCSTEAQLLLLLSSPIIISELLCFADTLKSHMLTDSYFIMVKAFECQPAKEKTLPCFLEAELKISFRLKIRKVLNLKNHLKA